MPTYRGLEVRVVQHEESKPFREWDKREDDGKGETTCYIGRVSGWKFCISIKLQDLEQLRSNTHPSKSLVTEGRISMRIAPPDVVRWHLRATVRLDGRTATSSTVYLDPKHPGFDDEVFVSSGTSRGGDCELEEGDRGFTEFGVGDMLDELEDKEVLEKDRQIVVEFERVIISGRSSRLFVTGEPPVATFRFYHRSKEELRSMGCPMLKCVYNDAGKAIAFEDLEGDAHLTR